MKPKALLAALVLFCVGATVVWGATTGAISGVITDAQTGEPVVGVTVMVMGTNLGASTDVDGRYTVINVPVGTYTLQMSSVGYATVEVSNVSVSVDLTTYQSQTMSSQATDIGKTIQVVAERKLVIEDKTTSVNIVTREELLALPTRGFEQVVGIQNSVVRMNSNVDTRQRGARPALATAPEINLRGGRPSEVAYYVDGFSQQDPLTGLSTANINNNAIKEVSVTSGAFSAEYGHVASGIVNVTTNSGTDKYHGNVEAVSDNIAGELGYDAFDQNWYSADFSGPIPGMENAYFFLSGERRYLGDRQPSSKTGDIFTRFHLDKYFDQPWQKPSNSLKGWSYQGKLDFDISPTFKLALSGNGSIDIWQRYIHNYMNPDFPQQVKYSPWYDDRNLGLNAKITHTLSSKTFYNLSATYFQVTRKYGDGVLQDDFYFQQRPNIDTTFDVDSNIVSIDTTIMTRYQREFANPEQDPFQLFQEGIPTYASDIYDSVEVGSPEDVVVAYTPSFFDQYEDRRSSYIGTKGMLTHQFSTGNTVVAGFDFQYHTLRFFQDLVPTSVRGYDNRNVNHYGFDTTGNVADPAGDYNNTKHPINLGIFLQDRLEYRGLIVQAGLRFDFFDYNAKRFRDIHSPFNPAGSDPDSAGVLDPSDLEDSKKFTRLSPRLGISFPISDRTQMHVNYGIFYQRPDLTNLYAGLNFTGERIGAGSYYPHPSPNLEPETITQYEVGMTHQLGENTAFDFTAYFKDVKDLTQIFHVTPADPYVYDVYGNVDYGTIKGMDFSLMMRRTRNISMNLKYSLSYASGTGSYSQSRYNIAWKNPDGVPMRTNPLDYDQRHSIIGIFDVRTMSGQGPRFGDTYPLENTGLNVIAQAASGLPYTPMLPYDAVAIKSVQQNPTGPINSAHLPWTFSIDLKLERTFKFGGYQMVPYLWIKNLLDYENVIAVYEGTGEPHTTGYLETQEGQLRSSDANMNEHTGQTAGETFRDRYDLLQNNPTNWLNPRMIMLGVRMSF
ncbi:MAG: TonB-dependent receptor [Candidatus Zixiibacteriota bacterium]